jgi:hypothetical protein
VCVWLCEERKSAYVCVCACVDVCVRVSVAARLNEYSQFGLLLFANSEIFPCAAEQIQSV